MKLFGKMHKYKTMLSYCFKCRKNTKNINLKLLRTSNGKTMILSNCDICGSKKSKLLSSLGIKTPLSKIPLVGPLLC